MSCTRDMTPTSLAATVALRTGKIVRNGFRFFSFFFSFFSVVFERGENLLQNGMLHFLFKLSQSLEIMLQSFKEFTRTKNGLFWKGLGTTCLPLDNRTVILSNYHKSNESNPRPLDVISLVQKRVIKMLFWHFSNLSNTRF